MRADSRSAETSLLRNKLGEIESQIKESQKVNGRLKNDTENKKKQLNKVENDIAIELEKFKWRKEGLLQNMHGVELRNESRLKEISQDKSLKTLELVSYDIIEQENEYLHSQLQKVSNHFFLLSNELKEEREDKRQRAFDTRMAMDQILRVTIKHFDAQYEKNAIEKMETEARNAQVENIHLFSEYSQREKTCEELIRAQQGSYDRFMKGKVKLDVISATTKMQSEIAVDLLQQAILQDKQIKSLIENNQSIQNSTMYLKKQLHYRGLLQEEKKRLSGELSQLQEERENLHRKALSLGKKLVLECLFIAEKSQQLKNSQLAQGFEKMMGEDFGLKRNRSNSKLSNRTNSGTFGPSSSSVSSSTRGRSGGSFIGSTSCGSHDGSIDHPNDNKGNNIDQGSVEDTHHSDFFLSKNNTTLDRRNTINSPIFLTSENSEEVWRSDQSDVNIMASAIRKQLRLHSNRKKTLKM